MKITSLLSVTLAAALTACASVPTPLPGVEGALAGTTKLNLRSQPEPAKTAIRFNMTGYTIIGVAMVAAASAKMDSQSAEFEKLLADHRKQNPQLPTFQDTFNTELEAALKAGGVTTSIVTADRVAGDKQPVQYVLSSSAPTQNPTVVIDDLNARLIAMSSTDPYGPYAQVVVTFMDGATTRQSTLWKSNPNPAYDNFDAVKKDIAGSYTGMLGSVRDLAKYTAGALLAAK